MSPRLFPEMDGLSCNTNWLIHRLGECAAAVPLLSCSSPGQRIQTDMLERMTNERGHCRYRSCLSVYVCRGQNARSCLVDTVGLYYARVGQHTVSGSDDHPQWWRWDQLPLFSIKTMWGCDCDGELAVTNCYFFSFFFLPETNLTTKVTLAANLRNCARLLPRDCPHV